MKILVLAGGTSTERDVSLSSGKKILKALRENGHDAIMVDVYLGYEMSEEEKNAPIDAMFDNSKDLVKSLGTIAEQNPDIAKIKALRPDGAKNFFGPNVIKLAQAADVVFMGLHGENGENGKIQACFDLMGITYTGNDCLSSAMSMNKAVTKDLFKAYDIPTPMGTTMDRKAYEAGDIDNDIPFPLIVKACSGGSSVGVAIANSADEYANALKEAFKYDDYVVIEQFIKGREFSVAVIKGKAYPIIEIAPKEGFYDYKNKYQAGAAVETCPADLPADLAEEIQRVAERAFEGLRLTTYARFDFLIDGTSGKYYFLEANTLPGMTPTSLVPQEAAAIGISYNELCEMLINCAFEK